MAKRQKRTHSPDLTVVHAPTHKRTRSSANNDHAQPQSIETRPMNALPTPPSHPRPARQLFICGSGAFGQLGMGSTEEAMGELHRPRLHVWFEVAVQGESHMLGDERGAGIERAVAGGMHSLVIDELGRVWSWGVNDHAALGRQTINVTDPDAPGQLIDPEILEFTPMPVTKLVDEGFRAVQVATGDSISVALNESGDIRAWGCFRAADGLLGFRPFSEEEKASLKYTDPDVEALPQLDPMPIDHLEDEQFVQVACGTNHVVALSQRGVAYCWGNGQHAELGRKIVERHKINGLVPTRLLLQRLVYVAAGAYHSFAIDENGVVYAWGLNSFRQTGVRFPEEYEGDRDVIWAPMRVSALDPGVLGNGRRVVQICGGEHHSLFLLNDGTVYGCGRCDASELGLGTEPPQTNGMQNGNGIGIPKVEPSQRYNIWTGFFKCIEEPTPIPFPPPPTPTSPDPPLVPSALGGQPTIPNPIARITACARHSFAVSVAGHAYAWGLGLVGELGLGEDVTEQGTPRRVRSATLDELREDGQGWKWVVEDVNTGGQHTLFVARLSS